jgi:hypothetical protein
MPIGLQRKDGYLLAFLFLVALLVFYPVFFSEYIYTDEVIQLWNYRPGSGFTMFAEQGRWLTELLISKSFAAVNSIHGIIYIRIFALVMWLLCIPVWYTIVKRIVAAAPAYEYLPFFTCLYLVTSLPFAITVQWASCIELPIANTAGLLAGAIWYLNIRDKKKLEVPVMAALGSLVAGLISLSAYQSGFGCFLIPFLFHFISGYTTRKDLMIIKGLAFYFLIYAVYFVLFKLYLSIGHVGSDPRTGLYFNPADKMQFFFSHPLKRTFWFNIIVDEENSLARAIYKVLLIGWMVLAFVRFGIKQWAGALKYIAVVLLVFIISYLPSLVVKENYASNRTMLALFMCVWFVCAEMAMYFLKNIQVRRITAIGVLIVLVIAGWYNYNKQFLQPVQEEYLAVKNYLHQHYNKHITTVYLIKPTEDGFKKKYHVQTSMDEFGVPSTFFEWVPELLMKQMVLEITGNRTTAEQLVVKHWPGREAWASSGETESDSTLLVDVPAIMNLATD